MTITVYSKPACVQCTATTRELNKRGLPFEVVDMSKDAEALDKVRGMGFQQAPVVIAGEDSWSGFRPDKIKALAQKAQPVAAAA